MTYTTPCKIISKYVIAIVSSHGAGALVNDGSRNPGINARYFEIRTGLAY
jgi:hypothetical protein